ncbi:hypothetical protein GCM10010384_23070 [Streptomyces djakartensis]|uniref:Uncharacterized protein n=1 Tax=Streptomyces djakartensis TaxID=68193 RepID=A0ABQ2ZIX6_9ACTN|nr:hypothetical protein GCM10010384_23070 [Streptomyces djakartensis]
MRPDVKAGRPVPHPHRPARPLVARSRSPFPWQYQKVSVHPLSVPVSCAAVSWTRSFQVPLALSPEAFTV